MSTLDKIDLHQSATISHLSDNSLKPKLVEMGLYPGKRVTLLYRAPLGDPIAIDVEGYTLSLRLAEASGVHLTVDS